MTREEILKATIAKYGESAQVDMMLEEMSELTKALLKYRRQKTFDVQLWNDIQEEMADVQIVLDQMKMIYGSTEEIEHIKIARLAGRLRLRYDRKSC